jgi:hypothetical protein
LLQSVVRPELRGLGFDGTGDSYRLTGTHECAILTLRASRSSTWAVLHFWAHLELINRTTGQSLAHHPDWFTNTSPIAFGFLGVARPAAVWTVYAGADTSAVAVAVRTAIHDEVMPWLRARLQTSSLPE